MLLGAVGDSSIKVWRMDNWEQTGTLSGHRGLVLALACYGEKLFSASDDRYAQTPSSSVRSPHAERHSLY